MSRLVPVQSITVVEVAPRDGLQNVAIDVPTAVKVELINALSQAGIPVIEAASFVSAKAVPRLADGAEVMRSIGKRDGTRYPVLVPNERGLDAALAAGATEIAVFTAASELFNQRNINASIAESIERFRPVTRRASEQGLGIRGYVSMAFGCPFQGAVPIEDVVRVCGELADIGCDEISIGDTIGIGHPAQVHEIVKAVTDRVPASKLALHLHDTWGRALANVLAGLEAGITTFDSSAGGLGGCPYAPGATGNLATEDLVSMLASMGFHTGIDFERLVDASLGLAARTGLTLPSRALAAARARRAVPSS